MYTDRPFARYLSQFSAVSPHTVTRCHSVFSCRCPPLSLNTSVVAMRRLQSGRCDGVYFNSGSAPRFPTRITLLTLPISLSFVPRLAPAHRAPDLVRKHRPPARSVSWVRAHDSGLARVANGRDRLVEASRCKPVAG